MQSVWGERSLYYGLGGRQQSVLTSNSGSIGNRVSHFSLSSTVYSSHTNVEHGAIGQAIQLVVTALSFIVLYTNSSGLGTATWRHILHLFVVGRKKKK